MSTPAALSPSVAVLPNSLATGSAVAYPAAADKIGSTRATTPWVACIRRDELIRTISPVFTVSFSGLVTGNGVPRLVQTGWVQLMQVSLSSGVTQIVPRSIFIT